MSQGSQGIAHAVGGVRRDLHRRFDPGEQQRFGTPLVDPQAIEGRRLDLAANQRGRGEGAKAPQGFGFG